MVFPKPPIFNLPPRFRRPALLVPAAALLAITLLSIIGAPWLPGEDEFGLDGPVVPARIIGVRHDADHRVATLTGSITGTFSGEMARRNQAALGEKVRELLAPKVDLDGGSAKGASYRILFEGNGAGDILAVEVSTAKQRYNAYRFTDAGGATGYYDEQGRAIMSRPRFSTPCDYGHVSSEFGYRRHPISRLIHFHGGVDLAAPSGTPVRAAADGSIAFSGRNGGAGNMMTISHGGGTETQYLHLSRFAPRSALGSRVRQGEVIGYVGSTGSSTGPHLDFRVIVDGTLRDPLAALRMTAAKRSLTMAELSGLLARIDLYKAQVDNSLFMVAGISSRPTVSL